LNAAGVREGELPYAISNPFVFVFQRTTLRAPTSFSARTFPSTYRVQTGRKKQTSASVLKAKEENMGAILSV
jgi:hypothetical protein